MKFLLLIGLLLVLLIVLIWLEIIVAQQGKVPTFHNPERKEIALGSGEHTIQLLVVGDSTSAGQGAPYAKGIAMQTAQFLAQKNRVTLLNVAISGAVASDVLDDQVRMLKTFNPDIVLLAVGANDVIHMTNLASLHTDIAKIIMLILEKNCNAKIILTGAPDMGTIPRFYPPLAWIATLQSKRVNNVINNTIAQNNLTYAPIFAETRQVFLQDRTLYAADRFHPNARGYAVWMQVLRKAISNAQVHEPSHCVR